MSLRNWFARTPGNSFGIGRRSLYISPKQLVSFEPYLHHARYTCIFIYSLHDFWNEISAEEGGDLKDFISKVKTFTNLTKISYIPLKYHQYQDQRLTVLFRSIVIMPPKQGRSLLHNITFYQFQDLRHYVCLNFIVIMLYWHFINSRIQWHFSALIISLISRHTMAKWSSYKIPIPQSNLIAITCRNIAKLIVVIKKSSLKLYKLELPGTAVSLRIQIHEQTAHYIWNITNLECRNLT